jgi:hypothetical protein
MTRNPFIDNLIVPYIKVYYEQAHWEMTIGKKPISFEVEEEEYTRVYRNKGNFSILFKFSAGALKLYLWIVDNLPTNSQSIKLDEKKLIEELFECSERHFKRLKAELVDNAIIVHYKDNRYWVNPTFFASGDRLKIYPECKKLVHTMTIKNKEDE